MRSAAPELIADSAALVFVADSIDAIGIFSIVVLVNVIVALTKVVIDIAVVTVPRRASSPAASTARTGMPSSTTA